MALFMVPGDEISHVQQSLMIKSTGRRLRMARQALVERLKVLVAKNALNQLGGDQTF